MSFAIKAPELGQSQTPWDTGISEVDIPANAHWQRWGPVNGLGQSPLDFITQFIPGMQRPVTPPPEDPVAKAMPLILVGVVGLGVIWYITRK